MERATIRVEKVMIPTYEAGEPDRNPMFLEKRVYQGSSGRVYPHPVTDKVADVKTDHEYTAVFLENKYVLVMILPELGGRVQRLYDKTNGYDAVYYNRVIKPALVGLAGPWISGGIEFNWPQHHRPSTFDPLPYRIETHEDGSVTCYVSELEKMFHTKGMAAFTLYPDKAYLEIKGQLYNPTDRNQTFLWWANPAVAVNDQTQSVFPPDVHAVMDHGKRDVSKFPIADGVYYKVDYAPGTDISRYWNIPVPTSYMAYHSDYDFVGNYDHGKKAGLLHIADHHISPGKKQWTWGCGDFGKAWDKNLTDEDGPYIELMTGVFTDNQPDFTYLAPYEEKTFTQYFMPYRETGAVKNACLACAVNLEEREGQLLIAASSPCELQDCTMTLSDQTGVLFEQTCSLAPDVSFVRELSAPIGRRGELCFAVKNSEGNVIVSCTSKAEPAQPVPEPAKAALAPQDIETLEELYLTAVHLEQYRHATYRPEDYYLEGLRRQKDDIRLNNGYGKLLYQRGLYARAEQHFRAAVNKSIWKNPNPYDSEPYYNLGLALERQGKEQQAFDAFYKASWSAGMQDKAFYHLALLACRQGDLTLAYELIEKSLVRNMHNMNGRNVKSALMRRLGYPLTEWTEETAAIDPMDPGCRLELYWAGKGSALSEVEQLTNNDAENYIELSLLYAKMGEGDRAAEILALCHNKTPMLHYYMAFYTGDQAYIRRAEQDEGFYGFTNRLEDMEVLQFAADRGSFRACYLLGNLLYDKARYEEGAHCWEEAAKGLPEFATPNRNLALYWYNKKQDPERSVACMERAFELNPSDARVLFELDQLYRCVNRSPKSRLTNLEQYPQLLFCRDDLLTEYITLLNLNGQYEKALSLMTSHRFHPWEGGEGKITAQYRYSLLCLAKEDHRRGDDLAACRRLRAALSYPENLGEGKLAGAKDNDLYYFLGLYGNSREDLIRATGGEDSLAGAMYYNDQPPEMYFYRAKAYEALGEEALAKKMYQHMIEYAKEHMEDAVTIDYFTVSLPDFLIFEADLPAKNTVLCCQLAFLGYIGLGDRDRAEQYYKKAKDKSSLAFHRDVL